MTNINIQIIITIVTVNTCVNVQWGVSDVHIGVRVGDAVVGDGASSGPVVLGAGGTPVSPDAK